MYDGNRQMYYSAQFMGQLGQQLPPGILSTGNPGELYIEGVGVKKFASIRQDFIYDRVSSIGTTIAAGTDYVFFRDISSKNRLATNMSQASVLPQGNEALIYNIAVMPHINTGPEDTLLFLGDGYFQLELDENNNVMSGPVWCFPSPYGIYGQHMTTNTTEDRGVITNGMAASSAVPRLMLPIYLYSGRTFRGTLTYFDAVTLAVVTEAYCILSVLMTRPVH